MGEQAILKFATNRERLAVQLGSYTVYFSNLCHASKASFLQGIHFSRFLVVLQSVRSNCNSSETMRTPQRIHCMTENQCVYPIIG